MRKIRAVIDTNVLRKTIKRSNDEFFIYQAFESELFEWVVSTEILNEYAEKLAEFYTDRTANLVIEILCNANNVVFAEPYYHWNITPKTPTIIAAANRKFSDLAISKADCLVTFDKHFNIFKELPFPPLKVLTPKQFKELLLETE